MTKCGRYRNIGNFYSFRFVFNELKEIMYTETITPEEIGRLEFASFPGKIYVIDSVGA